MKETFKVVRKAITISPVLAAPDVKFPYQMYTDANGVGLGAVLKQKQQGQLRTMVFYS